MIRFGTNPIAWANDDDTTIGADIPTARILDEAGRQIGFDGIENGHRWPQDDPEALRALLADHGLVFVSGWYSTNLLAGFQPLETNLPDTVQSLTNVISAPSVFYKIEAQ